MTASAPPASITAYETEALWQHSDLDLAYIDAVGNDLARLLRLGKPVEVNYQPGDGTRYPLVFVPLRDLASARPRVKDGVEWERHAVSGMGAAASGGYDRGGYLVSWVEHGCYPIRLGDRGILAASYVGAHWDCHGTSAVSLALLFRSVSWWLDHLSPKAV